jgi:hypothetical protein
MAAFLLERQRSKEQHVLQGLHSKQYEATLLVPRRPHTHTRAPFSIPLMPATVSEALLPPPNSQQY